MILDKANIPNSITSVEGLMLWCGMLLQNNHGMEDYRENPLSTGVFPRAMVTQFSAIDVSTQTNQIAVVRCAVLLPLNHASIAEKSWDPQKVIPWNPVGQIPSSFTS